MSNYTEVSDNRGRAHGGCVALRSFGVATRLLSNSRRSSPQVEEIIAYAEEQAWHTCDTCGTPNSLSENTVNTECEKCAAGKEFGVGIRIRR